MHCQTCYDLVYEWLNLSLVCANSYTSMRQYCFLTNGYKGWSSIVVSGYPLFFRDPVTTCFFTYDVWWYGLVLRKMFSHILLWSLEPNLRCYDSTSYESVTYIIWIFDWCFLALFLWYNFKFRLWQFYQQGHCL